MMWSTCHEHGTEQKKSESLWPSVHRSDALTTELRRTRDELDYIQGFSVPCLWHVDHIFSHFSPSFKFTIFIYHTHDDCILPSSPWVLPSSVVRASDPCQKGHKFNSCRGLRFFLVLVLVACWSHHAISHQLFSRWNPVLLPFKWNLFSSTFTWYYLLSI